MGTHNSQQAGSGASLETSSKTVAKIPHMRSARMWYSLQKSIQLARQSGLMIAAAYVDSHGKTLLLWRDTDAPLGALALAEAGAWTALVRTSDRHNLPDLLRARLSSNNISNLTENMSSLTVRAVDGGYPIVINDNVIVGAVCIIPSNGEPTPFSQAAAIAYKQSPYTATVADLPPKVLDQTDHYRPTNFGEL